MARRRCTMWLNPAALRGTIVVAEICAASNCCRGAPHDYTSRGMFMRAALGDLQRRAGAGLGLPLPGMQAAQRQRLQLQCAIPRSRRDDRGTLEAIPPNRRRGQPLPLSLLSDCGTTVHYRMDTQPGLIAIPVGAFADLDFPQPFQSFYHD